MENTQKSSVEMVPHNRCTGCGACMNICPKGAIKMSPDSEGFLFPSVDEESCGNCGKCERICPAVHPIKLNANPGVYSVWAENDIRKKSSSGGMMTLLARYIFEQGGAVCGAAFSEDYMTVHHIWANNEAELERIRGSKYVQSTTEPTYAETRTRLNQGQFVLYTGCPCQIAGLYRYLGKDYANLLTADIVCHGVPSPKVYRSYITELSGKKTLEKVDFREKAYWGWGTATSLFFTDGSTYRNDCFKDPYWRGFLGGLITRESCGTCRYSRINRVGDFTLGDFWGIGTIDPESDDKKGTSLVLVNSSKGRKVFKNLIGNTALVRKQNLDDVIELAKTRNGNLLHPTKSHTSRSSFFRYAGESPFFDAFEKSISPTPKYKFDIGYVGWWDSKNYGSALTCFALNRTLQNMGYSVLMLEHPGIKPRDKNNSYGMQFAQHFYDCSQITTTKDFSRFNSVCENFVVGSDQLWNWWCNKDIGFEYYFLNFVQKDHRKIAYSTSFGSDWTSYPESTRIKIGYYLSRFDAISVREKSGIQICKRDFNIDSEWVLDPVFLCDLASYDDVTSLSEKSEDQPYLFAYLLDPTEEKINAVRFMAEKKHLPYRIAEDGQGNVVEIVQALKNDPNLIGDLRIEDWLYYIRNADYVVTDSFHGFCFSIIFKKPVIGFINPRSCRARFNSIAEITGLEHFIVSSFEQIQSRKLWEENIDYVAVENKLLPKISFSRDWLRNALTAKKLQPSVKELQLWKTLEHDSKIYSMATEIDELKCQIELLNEQYGHRPNRLYKKRMRKLKKKLAGGLQCLKDNGLRYTIRHLFRKIKNRLSRK